MGNTLYLECNAGISGDMTVATLLDLGASQEKLNQVLRSLPVDGYTIEYSRVKKVGVDCMDFSVVLDAKHENHDHDMEYLHSHEHEHHYEHEHHHEHEHSHEHEHHHEHEHQPHEHHHHHEHRGLPEIIKIIDSGEMSENAKNLAKKIFDILAQVESKAHGVPMDQVHFHEVGAVDSIVDIVAVAVCLDDLDITEVIVPKVCEGHGTIRCQHGILPIPVPATANIIEMCQLPVEFTNVHGELVTPTGAAIVAAIKTAEKLPDSMRVKKIGMGAGKRNYERPSILRGMLLETASSDNDVIYKLEANVDDCTGESLGYAMKCLFEAGARDVHYMPVYMKKNRPGWQINVICDRSKVDELELILFRETTTIGIRRMQVERTVMDRKFEQVQTAWGEVTIKVCSYKDVKKYYPEYDNVTELAEKNNVSFQEVYQAAVQAYK